MRRIVEVLSVAACTLALLTPAASATIEHLDIDGSPFILVQGRLEFGDEKRFAEEALPHDDAIVVFTSPGGNLKAGMDIGKTIRIKGFSTVVPDGKLCASACALAWLGGVRRGMSPGSRIGFHAASTEENG